MEIRRGTTPAIIVEFEDTNVADLESAYLTMISDNIKIEKSLEDGIIGFDPCILIFPLSQKDTLQLAQDSNAQVQIKAKNEKGVFASEIINIPVKEILKEEEI